MSWSGAGEIVDLPDATIHPFIVSFHDYKRAESLFNLQTSIDLRPVFPPRVYCLKTLEDQVFIRQDCTAFIDLGSQTDLHSVFRAE